MTRLANLCTAAALLLSAAPAWCQDTRAPGTAPLEPQALSALDRMGRYLQSLPGFTLKARSTTEQILEHGEKVQLDAASIIQIVRPDRMRVDLTSDRRNNVFYYDGRTFTIYGKASGNYATVPAPGTLGELITLLADDYRVELPLRDLFLWGEPGAEPPELTLAEVIGPATIRGVPCDQYAFRQDGLDWQLWIQRGPQPLPRRLVLTTTTDEARPQYVVDLDWAPAAKASDAVFRFRPPPGTHSIPLDRIDEAMAMPR